MGKLKDSIMNWDTEPSCLDSAYERRAVEEGLVDEPVFEENWPEHRVDIVGANGNEGLHYPESLEKELAYIWRDNGDGTGRFEEIDMGDVEDE